MPGSEASRFASRMPSTSRPVGEASDPLSADDGEPDPGGALKATLKSLETPPEASISVQLRARRRDSPVSPC